MKYIAIIFTFLIIGIIVIAGFRPETYRFVFLIPFGDKLGHFILLGLFTFILNITFSLKKIIFFKMNILLGSLIVFCFITVEEITQLYISTRTFSFFDLLANYIGIIVFSYFSILTFKIIKLRSKHEN